MVVGFMDTLLTDTVGTILIGALLLLEYFTSAERQVVIGRVIEDTTKEWVEPWWPSLPRLAYAIQREQGTCGDLLQALDDDELRQQGMVSEAGSVTEVVVT